MANMSAASKPHIVVIPGAFHLKECMSHLISYLQLAGYPVRTATLTSTNNSNAMTADDVALIRDVLLEPLFKEAKDVVVLAHSYAGIPTSVAVEGNSKSDRQAKGLPGGIIGLVYICAFVPPVGASLYHMIGDKWTPWQAPDEATGLIMVPEPICPFYEDIDPALHETLVGEVQGHSWKALQDPATVAGYKDVGYDSRRAYVRCTKDGALPLFGQDDMVAQSGVHWEIISLETGHSPFLSEPNTLAAAINGLALKWMAVA